MIHDVRAFLPGDVGFATIPGRVGAWVNLGQALLRDSSRWSHAFLVLDNGECVEAMPSGARIVPLASRIGSYDYAYARLPLDKVQRTEIAKIGRDLEGTPYSFADYAALAAWEWHLPFRNRLRKFVSSSGHMICSQLVDYALCRVDYHLFDDGRLSQDVTPGDLFYATERMGWTL